MVAREFSRTQRVSEQLKRELSELLRREFDDSRFTWLSINEVSVATDFAHAKIFVSSLQDLAEDDAQALIQDLNHAGGFLRKLLGKRLRLRMIPQLHFQFDAALRRGLEMTHLIDEVVADDRARADNASDDEQ